MMQKNRGRANNNKRDASDVLLMTGLVILILTLASLCYMSRVLAKFAVSDSSVGTARVASMYIGGDVYSVDLSDIEKPGDSIETEIRIYGKAEVSLRYRFGIEHDGSMPLTVKITRTEAEGTEAETVTTLLETTLSELDQAIQDQEDGDEDAMPNIKLGTIEPASGASVSPNTDLSDYTEDYKYKLIVEWPTQTTNDTALDYPNLEDPYGRSVLTVGLYVEQVD